MSNNDRQTRHDRALDTDPEEVVRFLRDRYDALEEAARQAADGDHSRRWKFDPGGIEAGYTVRGSGGRELTKGGNFDIWAAKFIAANDPAYVLADVAAKRALLRLHKPVFDEGWHCELGTDSSWPCPTIRTLSGVYADHPDWREEWLA